MASEKMLGTHMNLHTKEKQFTCELCSKVYFAWSSCHSHRIRKHKVSITKKDNCFTCLLCSMRFIEATEVKQHMLLTHGENIEEDQTEMEASGEREQDLLVQQEVGAAEDSVQSISDDEIVVIDDDDDGASSETHAYGTTAYFKELESLALIEEDSDGATSAPKKEYLCDFCERVYYCRTSIHSHRIRTHNVNKKHDLYHCTLCDAEPFNACSQMVNHMAIHAGELFEVLHES